MWENIKKLIEEDGRYENINDFALKSGIASQVLYSWQSGKTKPSMKMLEKLSKHFGVPINYFNTGKLIEENDNFTNEVLLLAREISNNDKLQLIKDIMRIKEESDVKIIEMMTKKILNTQGK